MLGDAKNPVTVEGYTDNVPISTARYASNWELSAARAAAVVRAFAAIGIDPDRLAAVGYGEQHPVATNATPEGRAHNRRVTILVARSADAQRGLTTIGAERSKPLEIEWRDEKAPRALRRRTRKRCRRCASKAAAFVHERAAEERTSPVDRCLAADSRRRPPDPPGGKLAHCRI